VIRFASRAVREVVRDNLTLVPFILVAGAATSGFQVLMARALPPAAYAEAFAVLATLSLLATPTGVIQAMVARSAARMAALDRYGELRAAVRSTGLRLGLLGGSLAILVAATSPLLAHALQISSPLPLALAALASGLFLLEPLLRGALQGARDFIGMGVALAAHGLLRLAVGAPAMLAGGGPGGALLASPASALGGIGAGVYVLRRLLRAHAAQPPAAPLHANLGEHARVGVILAVMAAMLHLDALFVKAFFDPETAGAYAALALVGRFAFWAGSSVSVALLPYVVQAALRRERFMAAYVTSLTIMALLGGAAAIVNLVRPDVMYGLVFGDTYAPDRQLLPQYIATALMLAVASVTAGLHVGVSHLRVWRPLTALLAAMLIAYAAYHATPGQVLTVSTAGIAAAMLYLVGEAVWLARRAAPHGPV